MGSTSNKWRITKKGAPLLFILSEKSRKNSGIAAGLDRENVKEKIAAG